MTTPDPKAHVLSWGKEILEELEAAKDEIPPLVKAHEDATTAAREAVEFRDALEHLLGVEITRAEPAIHIRWDDHRRDVKDAKSRQVMAAAALEATRAKVASLQRALEQIDRVVPPAESEETA
jgi:hypothetical protein